MTPAELAKAPGYPALTVIKKGFGKQVWLAETKY
jgi:hypothetical protein